MQCDSAVKEALLGNKDRMFDKIKVPELPRIRKEVEILVILKCLIQILLLLLHLQLTLFSHHSSYYDHHRFLILHNILGF